MVKPRKKFSFSDKCPQFFKVYIPEQSSQRLRIPPAFLEQFDGVLPSKSRIRSHSRRSWRVEIKEVDNNLYFQKGWHEFVQDNSLEFGDFLVFCYGGDSIFCVKVYGKNGCQKEVCIPTRKSQNSLAILQENQIIEPRKYKQLMLEDNDKGLMAVQENDKALKPAGKPLSSYPYFEVVMKPAYVKNGFVNIPSTFGRSYMEKKGIRDAILRVSTKSWDVKLFSYVHRLYRFGKGWRAFSLDNTLQVGDTCVFELIDRDNFVLNVSVFRCHN